MFNNDNDFLNFFNSFAKDKSPDKECKYCKTYRFKLNNLKEYMVKLKREAIELDKNSESNNKNIYLQELEKAYKEVYNIVKCMCGS